jgi:NADPH:quinone reductase-like Zn-dependent oxidoreductase
MKAIAYLQSLPAEHPESLQDLQLPEPRPGPRDLLVEVKAISVNPVDTKIRRSGAPEDRHPEVLGWVGAGVGRAGGREGSRVRPGELVG